MVKVMRSKYRKGSIAIHFGDKTTRHVSIREAIYLAAQLDNLVERMYKGVR